MKILNQLKQNKGFTLIELLISVCIMAIAFAGLATMQIACINGNSIASNLTSGITLAQDKIEELKSLTLGDSNLADDNPNNNSNLQGATDDFTVVGATVDADDGHRETDIDVQGSPGGMYTRIWNVAANTPVSNRTTVAVIVAWKNHQVTVSSILGEPTT